MNSENDTQLAVFEGRRIRKAFHEGEWWFSIIDVVEVLVGGTGLASTSTVRVHSGDPIQLAWMVKVIGRLERDNERFLLHFPSPPPEAAGWGNEGVLAGALSSRSICFTNRARRLGSKSDTRRTGATLRKSSPPRATPKCPKESDS